MATKSKYNPDHLYQQVTDAIIERMENGLVPWRMPWARAKEVPPQNLLNGNQYKGVNFFLTLMCNYEYNYFLTFRQVKEYSEKKNPNHETEPWHVLKGSKALPIVFWSFVYKCSETGKKVERKGPGRYERADGMALPGAMVEAIPFLKLYKVFNVAQTNIPVEMYANPEEKPKGNVSLEERIEQAEKVLAGMPNPPEYVDGKGRAYYQRATDQLGMPEKERFVSIEHYYSTKFHELTHSTGHPKRLDRVDEMGQTFGDNNYCKEELVAELGAAFLCAVSGINQPVIDNQAAYLKGWLERLKDDNRLFLSAASKAKQAAKYILGEAETSVL